MTTLRTKRIAKNTIILYLRMLLLMLINFYTSRVILEVLGVEDFGVYNVIGGFVLMFSIFSKSLSTACSRFINYELGRNDNIKLSLIFSSTLIIMLAVSIVIIILCEILGLWYINNVMVIPIERLYAGKWVFQFSLLTFICVLLSVPYNACIIAYERMKAFAYLSLFEGIIKLIIAFVLVNSPIDVLILYGGLMFVLQLGILLLYRSYCLKNFAECNFRFCKDRNLYKEIMSYVGWNFLGTCSSVLRNQGNNVVLNLFFGPAVNAARAVANQVLHAVEGFSLNFVMAAKPQITQSYSSGNKSYMMELVFKSSKFSFFMLLIFSVPIIINIDTLLSIWLRTVPEHTSSFVVLMLVYTMIEVISMPLITAQLATGVIRNYQIIVGSITLLNVPISCILLSMGTVPETIFYTAIVLELISLGVRVCMLHKNIGLNIKIFISEVIKKIVLVSFISFVISILLSRWVAVDLVACILKCCVSVILTFCSILLIGCNHSEKELIYNQTTKIVGRVVKNISNRR